MDYDKMAAVYDAIYSQMKDYAKEARNVWFLAQSIFGSYDLSGDYSLLDVACGTGLHLEHFRQRFNHVEGLDLSDEMLDYAQSRLGDTPLHQGDMSDFSLRKQFDVVTCLFSAISHLTDESKLYDAISCMAIHLKPGGVLLIEPWVSQEAFEEGRVGCDIVDTPNLKVARFTTTSLDGRISKIEMHHMVARRHAQVEYFVTILEAALYSSVEFEAAFRAAGLSFMFDPRGLSDNGRGICIGTKPRA